MPCVVTDGVPMRTPLVTNGLRGSSGIVFLLRVMPASSSLAWASLPVSSASNGAQVDEHQVVVGAAGHEAEALLHERVGQRRRVAHDLVRVVAERGSAASRNATALPAMTCSSGPPCQPGNTALSIALRVLGLAEDRSRRAGRAGSCAW